MPKKETRTIDLNALYEQLCPKCKKILAAEVGEMYLTKEPA
jgi:hypothetical protein